MAGLTFSTFRFTAAKVQLVFLGVCVIALVLSQYETYSPLFFGERCAIGVVFFDMCRGLKEPFYVVRRKVFLERGRERLGGERRRLSWSDIPQAGRVQLVRVVKQRLHEKVLEAKMMRELLDVDDLTINGKVVWKHKPPHGFYARNRK